jgi:hypothetical protein
MSEQTATELEEKEWRDTDLDLIRNPKAWAYLKKGVEAQLNNPKIPKEVVSVFFGKDVEELMALTLEPNPVLRALARSRVYHEGESLGLNDSAGTTRTA